MPQNGHKETPARKVSLAQRITVWVTVAIFVWQPLGVAAAGIVADPNAGANRPIVDVTANGVPLVQITAPSAAGVSRNQYQQFNVDANGAILNNSRSASLTQQGGYVAGNPYLGCNSARIILNEVTSNNPSALRGYTEVAGSRAEVIIANPNGITCDGCGFINTSRGVLTTGTPIFGGGSLEGFRVTAGNIAINGAGLNAANIDRVDLISRTVEINGALWAKDARVIVGANEVNYADLGVRTIQGTGAVPAVGIDVAQLGGMYADKILLVGTENGVGVHSAGTLAATAGNFTLTSNGDVVLSGHTAASGVLGISSAGAIRNETTGELSATSVDVAAAGMLQNNGRIDGNTINLRGDSVVNTSLIIADDLTISGGTIRNTGPAATLAATGELNLYASDLIENDDQASIYSLGDINIAADGERDADGALLNPVGLVVNESGLMEAQGNMNIAAVDIDNRRGTFSKTTVTTASTANTLVAYTGYEYNCDFFDSSVMCHGTDPMSKTVPAVDILQHNPGTKFIQYRYYVKVGNPESMLGFDLVPATGNAYYEGTLSYSGSNVTFAYYPNYVPDVHIHPASQRSVGTDKGLIYEKTRTLTYTTTEERVASLSSEPQMLAGGNLNIRLAGALTNSMGTISAAGTVSIQGQAGSRLVNQGQALIQTDTTTGSSFLEGSFSDCMDPLCFNRVHHYRSATLPLTPQYQYATIDSIASAITAGQSIDINVGTLVNDVASSALVPGAGTSGSTPPGYTPALPGSGLFTTITEPDQPYLVETDPRFTSYKEFLSSDYMLRQLSADPQFIQKRLGDGFYEQKLVQEQIVSRTGHAVLADYASKEEQFKALMDQGLAAAQEFEFVPGVALSAEQITALNHDIVWMVAQDVTLPNGTKERVLAPVVYFGGAGRMNLTAGGALLAANDIDLITGGTLQNSGTIDGGSSLQIAAAAVQNIGGIIRGDGDVAIDAAGDILNRSGSIEGRDVAITAGGDITIDTASADVSVSGRDEGGAWTASNTLLGQRGSVGAAEGLEIRAGRDLKVSGADIAAGGDALLLAQGDITVDTVARTSSSSTQTGYGHYDSGQTEHQISTVQTGGDLTLASGGDTRLTSARLGSGNDLTVAAQGNLTIDVAKNSAYVDEDARDGKDFMTKQTYDEAVVGADLSAGNNATLVTLTGGEGEGGGNIAIEGAHIQAGTVPGGAGRLTVAADGDVTITEARERHESLSASHRTNHGMMSTTVTAKVDRSDYDLAVGSTLSGESVEVGANRDLAVRGSSVVGTGDVTLTAANDVTLAGAQELHSEEHYSYKKESGLLSGGVGITVGAREQKDKLQGQETASVSSTIGSIDGNLTISSGKNTHVTGSNLVAGQDINVTGKNVVLDTSADRSSFSESHEFKQGGLSLSINGGVVELAQGVGSQAQAIERTKDTRAEKLHAAIAYAKGAELYDRTKAAGEALADGNVQEAGAASGIKLSVSIGSSHSESHSTSEMVSNTGSAALAGGNLNINATEGDIDVIGSTLGGNNVSLSAAKDINLLAATDTTSNRSHNSSSSSSVGFSVGIGKQGFGLSLDIAASRGKGMADGDTATQVNTVVSAVDRLTIKSGADTTLRGAQASGRSIQAEVGGDLNIESLQDTGTYTARQESAGFAMSIPIYGAGNLSASVSASRSSADSDYDSVNQQAGLYAGDGGFDIRVEGNTDLKGAVIDGKAEPELNKLATGTLTVDDIHNSTRTASESDGLNVSTAMLSGKYEAAKGIAGNAMNHGKADGSDVSETRSAIAQGSIVITDQEKQQELTGNDAESAIASVSRDTTDTHRALARPDVGAIQEGAQTQRDNAMLVFDTVTAYSDKAYEAMFTQQSKIMRVVCKQEPCTYDPKTQFDPNRKDSAGNPNVVMVEISSDDLKNMSNEEKSKLVIATNGIFNETQRAGELALQNATPNKDPEIALTGNTKPDIVLVDSPYSGNFFSDLMVAGYEKFLAPSLGYTNPDAAMAETIREVSVARDENGKSIGGDNVGTNKTTMLGHSRGTIVERNALDILAGQGFVNDWLVVQAKGPAVTEEDLQRASDGIRSPNVSAQYRAVRYKAFDDDPVATFVGHSSNGRIGPSLLETGAMFTSPTSAHSCYGTAATGCDPKNVDETFGYNGNNPADLQRTRQAEVNRYLQSGPVVPNTLLLDVNREREQLDALRKQVGTAPLPVPAMAPAGSNGNAAPITDQRAQSLEQLKQQLQDRGQ